ncbi:hypothetical protein ACJJTC_000395 [Scirpophaga incertulas]
MPVFANHERAVEFVFILCNRQGQGRRSIVSPPPPPSRGVNVEPSEVELCAEWGTAHTSTRLLLFCSTRTSLHAMLHPPTTFTAHGLHLAAAIVGCIWCGKAKPTAPAASLSAAARARGAGVEFPGQCRRSIVSPPPPPSRGVNVEPSEVELCAEWGTAHTSTRLLLFCSTRTSLHAMLHPPTTFTAQGLHLAAAIVGCIWRGKAKPTAPAASLSAAARARGAGVEFPGQCRRSIVSPPPPPSRGVNVEPSEVELCAEWGTAHTSTRLLLFCSTRTSLHAMLHPPTTFTAQGLHLAAAIVGCIWRGKAKPTAPAASLSAAARARGAGVEFPGQCRRSIVSPPPPPSRGVNVEPSEVELCAEWGTAHTSTRLLLFCSTRTSSPCHAATHRPHSLRKACISQPRLLGVGSAEAKREEGNRSKRTEAHSPETSPSPPANTPMTSRKEPTFSAATGRSAGAVSEAHSQGITTKRILSPDEWTVVGGAKKRTARAQRSRQGNTLRVEASTPGTEYGTPYETSTDDDADVADGQLHRGQQQAVGCKGYGGVEVYSVGGRSLVKIK